MDPTKLKLTAAAAGVAALTATALIVGGGRGAGPAQTVRGADEAALVERVTAALAPPPSPIGLADVREIVARMPSGDAQETAAAIATATRLALAAIAADTEAPAPHAPADDGAEQPDASGFRRVEDAAPAFVISAADAWIAAGQGWAAASGVAPVTIEPRPRARSD